MPTTRIGQQARIYLRGLASSSAHDSRFVIYCRGRDGSTLLVDLLNQLPQVYCDGEILHLRVAAPRLYVRGCQSIAPGTTYGFKLLSHHLTHVQAVSSPGAFLRHLDGAGYKIIHLTRRNQLRQVLSNFYVAHRGGYAGGHHHHRSADGPLELARMTVDVDELGYWLRENERRAEIEAASLSGLHRLELVYEDDLQQVEDQQRTADRAAEFLGVRPAAVRAGLTRLTTDDLAQFVSNHEELVRFVEQTPYRRFLDGP